MSDINKPTPGPWSQSHRKNARGSYSTEVYDTKGEVIATVDWYPVKTERGTGTNREANATLIAAAPHLLEATRIMIAHLFGPNDTGLSRAEIEKVARAAIAKATGAA